MTCIVAVIESDRHVVMGADSAGISEGDVAFDLEEPKIWRYGEWLVGFSGPIALLQATARVRFPELVGGIEGDPERAALDKWFEKVREVTGHTVPGSSYNGYSMLVARETRLWLVQSAGHVLEKSRRRAMACGSGMSFAMGAMYTFRGRDVPAAAVAEAGMRAACGLCSSAWLPAHFFTTSGEYWMLKDRAPRARMRHGSPEA